MYTAKEKVALEVLKNECSEVETHEEASVIVRLLEHISKDKPTAYLSFAAPELNVMKKVAIIRTPELSLDLVNPKIIKAKGSVLAFHEPCFSFEASLNCLRYEEVVLQNGLDSTELTFSGMSAALVQHAVDHLNGVVFYDKAIKLAIVRKGGRVFGKDFCPCGSSKRFSACCMTKRP